MNKKNPIFKTPIEKNTKMERKNPNSEIKFKKKNNPTYSFSSTTMKIWQ